MKIKKVIYKTHKICLKSALKKKIKFKFPKRKRKFSFLPVMNLINFHAVVMNFWES